MGFVKGAVWVLVIGVLISALVTYFIYEPILPLHFGGYVEPGFESVEYAFRCNFEKGLEPDGASFAVCHEGKLVVDLWGGYADKMALRKWKEDTMSTAFSSTKGVASMCIALLVERGLLKYDDLIVKYWPEFGAHGKDKVTVKMLVSHQAGLPAVDTPVTAETIKDWKLMSKVFENQKPKYTPGTETIYHAFTHGFLCDQLLRRVDPKQRSLGQFFKQEIAVPFGIDFHIGLPLDQLYRVTRMTKATIWDIILRLREWAYVKMMYNFVYAQYSSPMNKSLWVGVLDNPNWLQLNTSYFPFNNPDIHELEVPAANGVGTARALARLYCLLIDGKKPLISKKLLEKISQPVPGEGGMMGMSLSWGFFQTLSPNGKNQMGHPGYGGQQAKVDHHENLAFAYLRNNMGNDAGDFSMTFSKLQTAVYESIRKN